MGGILFVLLLVLSSITGNAASEEAKEYYLSDAAAESSGDISEAGICLTEECVTTASDLLESLDTSIDPCQDFYQFSCGGWMKRQLLPPHRVSMMTLYNQDEHLAAARNLVAEQPQASDLEAVKKAKTLYASCINHTSGVRDYKSIVNVVREKFGQWPLPRNNFSEETFSLQQFLTEAIQLRVYPLFQLDVALQITLDDAGKIRFSHALQFGPPVLGLPINTYAKLFKDDLNRQIYANKIYDDAKRFGIEDREAAQQDALEVLEVERTLAKLYQEVQDEEAEFKVTLGLMDENFGQLLNWTDFVSALGSSPDIGITDINSEEEVVVKIPEYLWNLTEYFTQLPARTKGNYIMWRVVDSLQSVLIQEYTKMETVLKRTVFGTTAEPSPEEACVAHVSRAFQLAVHRLLYTDQLPKHEITTLAGLLKEIQREFDQLVDEHAWLDSETLKQIKEKNAALAVTLINFERAMNDSLLDTYYRNVTVSKTNFFSNVILERREAFARNFRSLEKPYERTLDSLPHELVAQNFFVKNQLEFTSVMFEPPLFINNVPMSVNYAGTGQIFGHEIVHAFDNTGIRFSKEGVPGDWWKNNETLQVFKDRSQCLVDQYNNYFYKRAGQYVDGQLTLGENIADSAGIKLAFRAYKKYVARQASEPKQLPAVPFTDEQVFFVKFAQNWCNVETAAAARWQLKDPHSPNEFRVIGSLQNFKEFGPVFNCPLGSRMNPREKCEVW
ncbi:hypothetical protein BsWGS_17469 [Bradybaena similaris]